MKVKNRKASIADGLSRFQKRAFKPYWYGPGMRLRFVSRHRRSYFK